MSPELNRNSEDIGGLISVVKLDSMKYRDGS